MHPNALWPTLFWTWTLSEIALALATHTRKGEGTTQDRGSLFVLWTAILASITAASWLNYSLPALDFTGSPWLKPLTCALLLLGLIIRWTAILSLGKSFSVNVAIHATQSVYRQGIYRLVRHPSYLGMLLIFAAIGLRARNWLSLATMLVVPTAALLFRVHIEEKALRQAFGPEYDAYCRTTRRLIPGIY